VATNFFCRLPEKWQGKQSFTLPTMTFLGMFSVHPLDFNVLVPFQVNLDPLHLASPLQGYLLLQLHLQLLQLLWGKLLHL